MDYLYTYHPEVVNKFSEFMDNDLEDEDLQKKLHEWLKDEATVHFDKRHSMVPNMLIIEVRFFDSMNGTCAKMQLDMGNIEGSFKLLLEKTGSVDIVDWSRKSIMNFRTREQFVNNGPEFYLVKRHVQMMMMMEKSDECENNVDHELSVVAVHPSFDMKMHEIVVKFVYDFMNSVLTKIANDLVSLKDKTESENFYNNLGKYLSLVFSKTLDEFSVKHKTLNKIYTSEDILKMLNAKHNIGIYKTDSLKKHIVSKMSKSYGSMLHEWFDDIGDAWEHELYPDSVNEVHPHDVEFKFVNDNLTKFIGNCLGGTDIYDDFIDVVAGKGYVCLPTKEYTKKVEVKPIERKLLFKDIETPCAFCNSIECKLSKAKRKKGVILEYANTSHHCPKTLFNKKMMTDMDFARLIAKSQINASSEKRKNPIETHVYLMINMDEPKFDINHHWIVKEGLNKFEDKTTLQANEKMYEVIGSNVSSADLSFVDEKPKLGEFTKHRSQNIMEYCDPKTPGVMFIISK